MSSRRRPRTRNRATIADVARRAGVSTATVSRVINQTAPVGSDTVAQVRRAIAELDYRPSSAARVLASRRTNSIGLLISQISDDFFSALLRGIEAKAREEGHSLLIYSTQGREAGTADSYPLGEHNTDGVLVFGNSVPEAELFHFHQIGFPVVLIHRSAPLGLDIPCVTIENKHGARMLIDHLIEEHSYSRIAFLTGEEGQEDSVWREMGYRESLAAHGIPYDPDLVAAGGYNRTIAQDAAGRWLAAGLEFEAVMAGDDEAAIGVLSALNRAGKRVPEDIAVVGFDDVYVSQYLNPPLTTVRAPTEQVGREAVGQLVKLIQGGELSPIGLLPVELVVRRSCGCAYDQFPRFHE